MIVFRQYLNAFPPVVMLSMALGLCACAPKEQAAPQTPEVVVQRITPQDVDIEKSFTAQTEGSREVEIRPRVTGILLKRYFKEGEHVKQGDLLYQIDPAEYQAKVAQAEAQLAQQQSALHKAERDYARLKPLLADNAVSQRDVDDAQSALENARAGLQAMTAQLQTARLNLSYTKVTAPVAGITSLSSQPEGALLQGAQTLLTKIVQTDPMYVKFSLSEQEKLNFERNRKNGTLDANDARLKIALKLSDGSTYPLTGKLNFAAPLYSTSTGTLQVRAEFPNPQDTLLSGQFGKVVIQGMTVRQAILLPQKAILTTAAGRVVMVVDDANLAQPRPIEVGDTRGSDIFITHGLKAGERVIVQGLPKVQAGQAVKIVPVIAGANGH